MSTHLTTRPSAEGVLSALRDIQWMARRAASWGGREQASVFAEATWLLERLLARHRLDPCRPDRTTNPTYPSDEKGLAEVPSIYADGTAVDFEPVQDRAALLQSLDEGSALQWISDVLHPLAHAYADGRSTYATSDFNSATRTLRNAGFSLAATMAAGRSAWVADGMGYDGLSPEEAAERDAAPGRVRR